MTTYWIQVTCPKHGVLDGTKYQYELLAAKPVGVSYKNCVEFLVAACRKCNSSCGIIIDVEETIG